MKKCDLISREALKEAVFEAVMLEKERTLVEYINDIIDNAPTVSDRYDEGYAQGYIDGSTGADMKGGTE